MDVDEIGVRLGEEGHCIVPGVLDVAEAERLDRREREIMEGMGKDPDFQMVGQMGVGAVVTTVLMVLHHRFLWFPFHPVGYAIACGWVMSAAWRVRGFTGSSVPVDAASTA